MKQILLFFLGFIFACDCYAQNDSGIYLEFGGAITRNTDLSYYYGGTVPQPPDTLKRHGLTWTIRTGYRFNKHWTAGLKFRRENVKFLRPNFGWGVFGEYSFFPIKVVPISIFAEAYILSCKKIDALVYYHKHFTEMGVTPGLAIHIPKVPIVVKIRYLFMGLNDNERKAKQLAGCNGRSNWIFDAGRRRLEFSLAATIKWW